MASSPLAARARRSLAAPVNGRAPEADTTGRSGAEVVIGSPAPGIDPLVPGIPEVPVDPGLPVVPSVSVEPEGWSPAAGR